MSSKTAFSYEDKVLLLLTLIIGAVVGLVVVAFIVLTDRLGARLYPGSAAAWRRIVIPVAGSLITGILLSRYFPDARGSGIAQTKIAMVLRDGFISFQAALGKFSMSTLALASGISLGPEGPSVHVAAGIASTLGRKLRLSPSSVKALLPVASAAALAAAFNTPIAAVLFVLEEIVGGMEAPVLGSVILASATSWIVLHLLLGDEPLFHVPAYQLVNPIEFPIYAVLGVAGGLVSVGFLKLLLWERKHFLKMPKSMEWWKPTLGGGLVVGVMGLFFPQVLGVGYKFVGQALNGDIVLRTMAVLVLMKVVATASCYASGNAGGLLACCLYIGAMLGGAVGGTAHMLLPDFTGSAGAYALVGMGTAFAGIIRVPLTSVVMIFELTRDYSVIVPLMISNLISFFISRRLQEEQVYEAMMHQDGIHLPGAHAREALMVVGQAFRQSPKVLPASLHVSEAVATIDRASAAWPVVDAGGLRGMLTIDQLDKAVKAGRQADTLEQLVPAPDTDEITAKDFPHVHADHTLDLAMRRMAEMGLKVLPVVSRTNIRALKGVISLEDIMRAYATGKPGPAETPAAPPGRPARLLAGIVATLMGMTVIGVFLTYYFRAERIARAQRFYDQGNQLLAKDLNAEAVEDFRNALSISHTNQYRQALALALVKQDDWDEAGIYLRELLHDDPTSAAANLGMARVAAGLGRIDEAVTYYHDAIYGAWPANQGNQRLDAHFELVALLGRVGRYQQARAELLSILATPRDLVVKRRVAPLLLQYGDPKEAADLLREITAQDPRDEGSFLALGEAEYSMSHYSAARAALVAALRLNPNDTAAEKRLDDCTQILTLDPTLRGLRVTQRYQRSQALLTAVVAAADKCSLSNPADALAAARKSAATRSRPRSYGDATDQNVALAAQLWQAITKSCSAIPADTPLGRVMALLMSQ